MVAAPISKRPATAPKSAAKKAKTEHEKKGVKPPDDKYEEEEQDEEGTGAAKPKKAYAKKAPKAQAKKAPQAKAKQAPKAKATEPKAKARAKQATEIPICDESKLAVVTLCFEEATMDNVKIRSNYPNIINLVSAG